MSNKEEKILVDCGGDKPIAMTKEQYQQLRRDEVNGGLYDYLGIDKGTVPNSDLDKIVAWEAAGKPLDKPLPLETKGLEGELKNMEILHQKRAIEIEQDRANYNAALEAKRQKTKGNE